MRSGIASGGGLESCVGRCKGVGVLPGLNNGGRVEPELSTDKGISSIRWHYLEVVRPGWQSRELFDQKVQKWTTW